MSESADMSAALAEVRFGGKAEIPLSASSRGAPRHPKPITSRWLNRTSLVSQGCVVLLTRCGMAKRYRESAADTAGLIILIQDGDDL